MPSAPVTIDLDYGSGQCAVCRHGCPFDFLMCGPCWRQVPLSLQARVYAALRRYRIGAATLGELRDAQNAAVEAVTGKATTSTVGGGAL